MSNLKLSTDTEEALAAYIAEFYDDPYGLVMAVFPWGEPCLPDGSFNPLHNKRGPEPWQKKLLIQIGDHIRENGLLAGMGLDMEVWRSAIASGHGVGKSAIVAWLIYFLMSTRVDTRGVVTASTQFQLEDKTWPELAKWHSLAMNKHWFEWTATSFYFKKYPADKQKNYMVTAATVSEHKTEAFAGLHNETGTVFIMFDEASGVLPKVWEVSEGALTDGEAFFFAFGNPTRPEGEFADCFDKHKDLYYTMKVDSREVSHTNKLAIKHIISKYGDDSDEVRIRVKGEFPAQSYNGFISKDAVVEAMARPLVGDSGAALIMAIDVARFGDDSTVIGFRQGRDNRSRPCIRIKGQSTTKVAEIAMMEANKHKPDVIVIESTGPGVGVIDMLRDRGYKVVEVHPGAAAHRFDLYFNRRAEIWALMRDWIYEGGCLPLKEGEDPEKTELYRDLVHILYGLDRHEQRIKLEAKADMKKRRLPSPDEGDMLALTFAVTVPRRDSDRFASLANKTIAVLHDDPLAMEL